MISKVRANVDSFRTVTFTSGLNVVLADRTKESTVKDSRNGLGKSTLIEIIHFCLGASAYKDKGLRVAALRGWVFALDLSIGDRNISVSRSTDKFGVVDVQGDVADLGGSPLLGGVRRFRVEDWCKVLGELMFGLPQAENSKKWSPTFRSMISYFVRRKDEFSRPFEHYRQQHKWDTQVNNAYLLGLAWTDAQDWKVLEERDSAIKAINKASATGVMDHLMGTVGELEAEKVRLESEAEERAERLRTFQVHPEYREIEQRASELTRLIHKQNNSNVLARRRLAYLTEAVDASGVPEAEDVIQLFDAVGVELPGVAVRRLQDVQSFHQNLIANRKDYLESELESVRSEINSCEEQVWQLSDERAGLLMILSEHGALDEFSNLQRRHLDSVSEVNDVVSRLANLKKVAAAKSELKIEKEHLQQRARRDYEERREIRERSIRVFNSVSQALYQAPGRLILDVTDKGFKFDVEIERAGSAGIRKMKTFCYDMTLAQLWAGHEPTPGFLIHDSAIFDGVDERQIALALHHACSISSESGFQYICTLNSDAMPLDEFPDSFKIEDYVRMRLTDDKPEGSLLGIRY